MQYEGRKIATAQSLAFQRVITLLVLLHFVAILAMAALPRLHDWAHHDEAHDADHQCAVTLFANGSIDLSPAPTQVSPAGVTYLSCIVTSPAPCWVESQHLSRSVLEHAPPERCS